MKEPLSDSGMTQRELNKLAILYVLAGAGIFGWFVGANWF